MSERDFYQLPLAERIEPRRAASVMLAHLRMGQLQKQLQDEPVGVNCYRDELGQRCAVGVLMTGDELDQLHGVGCNMGTSYAALEALGVRLSSLSRDTRAFIQHAQMHHDNGHLETLRGLCEEQLR